MSINSEQSTSWSLIVNGDPKPWPIKDYLDTPITIDLNWGIDTDIYESTPLTFNVSDIINGRVVEGVTIDNEHHHIICNIPIREKIKTVKVVIDWSNLKNNIKNNLNVVIGGNPKIVEDNSIQLVGKDIKAPIEFYFNGIKCESFVEDELNMIRVNLPYNNSSSYPRWLSPRMMMISASAIFIIGLLGGFLFKQPKVIKEVETKLEIKTDTLKISKSLNIAQSYLQRDKWYYNEMELIPELQGLFDDLKNYRFDQIKMRLDCNDFEDLNHVNELLETIKRLDSLHVKDRYSCTDKITFSIYIRELKELHHKNRDIESKNAMKIKQIDW